MSFITTVPNLLKCNSRELGMLGIITSRAVARIFHWGGSNCERSDQVSANNPRSLQQGSGVATPGGVQGQRAGRGLVGWSPRKTLGPLE